MIVIAAAAAGSRLASEVPQVTDHIPIAIRDAVADDEAFICSSFLRSHRLEGSNAHMTNDTFFARYNARAEAIARGAVLIACSQEDPWHIFGWLAYKPGGRLVYAYTKSPFRRMGVFTRLHDAAGSPLLAMHTGRNFAALKARFGLAFNPGDSP